MDLNEALRLGEIDFEKKIKEAKAREIKRIIFILGATIIAFIVAFFAFFKHREVEMSLKQFELLKMLLPWGYTARYETGVAIIENFVGATFLSVLISMEIGVLAFLLESLLGKK
jgi:ABC-type proline/glycine betaine transport system permease subunit